MKMLTHIVFGAGAAAFFSPELAVDQRLLVAAVLSLLVNPVIDELGHVVRKGFIARSPITHSVFTAPLWGGGVGYLLGLVLLELGWVTMSLWVVLMVTGAVVALSHLFLDALTERGVYFLTKRIALAHFGTRNILLNGAFSIAGLILIVACF